MPFILKIENRKSVYIKNGFLGKVTKQPLNFDIFVFKYFLEAIQIISNFFRNPTNSTMSGFPRTKSKISSNFLKTQSQFIKISGRTLIFDWIQNLPCPKKFIEVFKDDNRERICVESMEKRDKVMQHAQHAIDLIISLIKTYEKFPSIELAGSVSDMVASGKDVLEEIMGSLENIVSKFEAHEIFDITDEYETRLRDLFVPGYMVVGSRNRYVKDFHDITKLTCIIVHSYLLEIEEFVAIVIEVLKKSKSKVDIAKYEEASIDFLDSSINLKEQLKYQIFKTNLAEKIQEDGDLDSIETHPQETAFITISDDSLNTKSSMEQIFPSDLSLD